MLRKINVRHFMTLSLDEVLEYNALVEKENPKFGEDFDEVLNRCPACKSGLIAKSEKYCSQCGQRVTFVEYTTARNGLSKIEEKTAQGENMGDAEAHEGDIIPIDSPEFEE